MWGHLGIAVYDPAGHGAPGATLQATPPMWAEVVGGIAPVLFLVVCGMMVAYLYRSGESGLRRQLGRMGALLAIGAGIDVLFWGIRPFTTVDVLYCIALALPLTHLFVAYAPRRARWALVAMVFALTPLLQHWLGYADYPTEYTLSGKLVFSVANQTSVANHWLVNGWFPMFPWLGFALLGALLAERRRARGARAEGLLVATGSLCLVAGLLLGWPDAGTRSILRLNAGGAFMPPDLGYMLSSIGLLLMLMSACDHLGLRRLSLPLRLLGRAPLFLYVVHFAVVNLVARLLPSRVALGPAVVALAVTLAGLTLASWLWLTLREVSRRTLARRGGSAPE